MNGSVWFSAVDMNQKNGVGESELTCVGKAVTIQGTAGDDILVGTDGEDVINGLDGNDTIRGLRGNDIICGGDGNDKRKTGKTS